MCVLFFLLLISVFIFSLGLFFFFFLSPFLFVLFCHLFVCGHVRQMGKKLICRAGEFWWQSGGLATVAF